MCWITTNKDKAKPRTADKDIDVFKVCLKEYGSDVYNSLYFKYEYRIGGHYHSTLYEPKCLDYSYYKLNIGIHSYDKTMVTCTKTNTGTVICVSMYNEGEILDVFKRSLFLITGESLAILNCIIPKGSTYYINEKGECVSSKLIVKSASNVLI